MLKLGLGLLTMGLLAAFQGACGGSTAGDASPAGDGGPIPDGARPGDFIAADAGGVTVRGELDPSAGTIGVVDGLIWAVAKTTSDLYGWHVYVLNSVGTNACPPGWVALFQPGQMLRSDNPGGSCSVTVTSAAPALGDVLEGTFTATLTTAGSSPRTVRVTNGVFHVTRDYE